MTMASSGKPRQPRLRASCDGCFLAKVKCSKARPICTRCLACGLECRYSPSSRAGKPKADHSSNHNTITTTTTTSAELHGLPNLAEERGIMLPQQFILSMYKMDQGWDTPPTSVDGGMSRTQSISSGLTMIGLDTNAAVTADSVVTADMYGTSNMPWTPPHDLSAQYAEASGMHISPAHGRSQSYDLTMPSAPPPWIDTSAADAFAYSQSQLPTPTSIGTAYFPSPVSTPTLRTPRQKSASVGSVANVPVESCTCFTACLQSLQTLHNASTPVAPALDAVLGLNRKAVESCAAMLSCMRCMSRSGTHTAAMLLATIIGKIISFYQNAAMSHCSGSHQSYQGPMQQSNNNNNSSVASMPLTKSPTVGLGVSGGTALGIDLGAYHINEEDGRWLELEILALELRKLEEVFTHFRDACADLYDDPELSRAMIGHLGQTLGSTIEVIQRRKGGMVFS